MLARWPRPPAVRFCAARRSTCRPICTQADGTTWISASGRAHWGKGQERRRMGESMKRAALFILAIAAVTARARAQSAEERRGRKGWGRTCRFRGARYHEKKKM